ncbi:MAG: LA_2272 family surface repeat-containing protein [Bacteroidales bacterium]
MRIIYCIIILLLPYTIRANDVERDCKPINISLFGLGRSTSTLAPDQYSCFVLGLPVLVNKNIQGLGVSILGSRSECKIIGANISGIYNISRDGLKGFSFSGLTSYSQGHTAGLTFAGATNILYGSIEGVQLSGVTNFTIGYSKGLQLALFSNFNARDIVGAQISSFTNVSGNRTRGLQLSGFLNTSLGELYGAQIGIINYAKSVYGAQVGLINVAGREVSGVQMGLINYAYDRAKVQLGLVNLKPTTDIKAVVWGGSMTAYNFGIRFQNRYSYNILAIGYPYDHTGKSYSGAFTYRKGYKYEWRRIGISADLGYSHINIVSDKEPATLPPRLWSVQARGNLSFRFCSFFELFATAGYHLDAPYNSFNPHKHEPLYEIGFNLF